MENTYPQIIWTEDLDRELLDLWPTRSASEIAFYFNDRYKVTVSRNAVVGRIHRIRIKAGHIPKGLPRRKVPLVPPPIVERKPMTLQKKPAVPPPYKPLGTCQFFVGDYMCGKISRGSWCEAHEKVVYLPKTVALQR